MGIITRAKLREYRNTTRTFSKSATESLNEWSNESKTGKVTIFLSHKHDEIEELDGAITLLKRFGVNVYVDWQDEGMPKSTSGKTAKRIKDKIRENRKFIFLATEGAIASKWCNWELGFGDSLKFLDHIAIFPIRNTYDRIFSGSEYLNIYPSIEYKDGNSKTVSGDIIPPGYYVLYPRDEKRHRRFKALKNWLAS